MTMAWGRSAAVGVGAGAAGVVAMTLAEKLEQRITGRPDSYVPARTLERLLGLAHARGRRAWLHNLAMHASQGAMLGALRGVMAGAGLRGPWASLMFFAVRLTNDQTFENATGVGAPPWTWPRDELVVDLVHKAVYAFATGLVADALAARRGSGPGQVHAEEFPGRRRHIGPPPRE
ncbi:hypothetical protein SAXI111661_18070 [Saccharomonospora xinjiangensis]|nr:hypothetical protein EYD13_09650 [Saccharomonospora xinjiangensis]